MLITSLLPTCTPHGHPVESSLAMGAPNLVDAAVASLQTYLLLVLSLDAS